MSINSPIDFVLTWVDGNDEKWKKTKEKYEKLAGIEKNINTEERFRDWDTLKYWFRAVERYAPWVNKIHFVTEGHLPEWLNTNHEKINIVMHKDFIDNSCLPTFNSSVIMPNLGRILSLSENFVTFNDDMFLNDFVKDIDFFKNNIPCDTGIFSPIVPARNTIINVISYDLEIINDYFNSRDILKKSFFKYFNLKYGKHIIKNFCVLPWKNVLGFYDSHIPFSYKKTTFKKIYELESELFKENDTHRFRTRSDVNEYIMRYWQLCEGNFEPRSYKFGQYYNINVELDKACRDIKNSKHKVICLNDGPTDDFENQKRKLLETFKQKYPKKSRFEK